MKKTTGITPEGKIETITEETLDSVELNKTTKGYTWSIKMYATDAQKLPARIEEANKSMERKFGGEDENQS